MSQPTWIGYNLGGRYKIDALLGQGGMSAVYQAHDPNLRRTVAVKLIHAHLSADPEFVRRFEAEAAAVAQLRHPNIVQVFDFNHDGDTYYMVMEYLPGESLQARLRHLSSLKQRFSLPATIGIIAPIADAVAYAHERGTIHRDLKPANVMLMPREQPVLTDFGVAKILGGQHHTATGAIIGTPAYMSPEQVRGSALDGRADIYSLGIILYEMAAGRPPFEGDSAMTIMLKHVNEPVPDIRTRAEVPQALKDVLDRALAKDPADRFQSAADLANSLRALMLRPTAPVDQPTQVPGPADRAATVIEPVPAATIHEAKPATQAAEHIAPAARPPSNVAISGPPVATAPPAAAAPARSSPPAVAAPARSSPPWLWLGGLGLAVVVCLLIGVGIAALGGPALLAALGGASTTPGAATRTPEATQIAGVGEPTLTPGAGNPTSAPPEPTGEPPTLAPTEAPTGTPEPTAIPVPQGMLLIPGGAFSMGSEAGGDTRPAHAVTLSGFFLDQTEVTNARYQACVDAGACTPPQRRGSDTRGGYFTDPAFANYPMLNVTWAQADAFCHAEGKRLPTEAEWEYAATGGDGRLYPWGNTFDPGLLPVQAKDTVAVGSFPEGASPFGALDMAGNALEWVNDWYGADYYASSPAENPTGPESGTRKVLRGGSFGNPDVSIYITTRRFHRPPNGADVDIGFRCAMPMP